MSNRQKEKTIIKRAKSVIILEALLSGQQIQIDEQTYAIDVENRLCHKMRRISGDTETEEWYIVDCSLGGFINMCNKISDAEMFIIGGNNVLHRMAQESIAKRTRHMDEKRRKKH